MQQKPCSATLSHVEAALESRESELHESWHALRLQAADLQSDAELTPELLQPDASARVRCCCVSQLVAMTAAYSPFCCEIMPCSLF